MNESVNNSKYLSIAKEEIEKNNQDTSLWRKAIALTNNLEKAKEKYIKLRAQQLKISEEHKKNSNTSQIVKTRTLADVEQMTEEEKRARYGKK